MAFAVLRVGGNATSLGIVLLVGTVAGLASYQVAGVWADRLSRRNLMLAADLLRLAVEAGIAALLLTGHARIWELALAAAIVSIGTAAGRPQASHEHFLADLATGWREVISRRWAWSTLIGNALSNMAFAVFEVLGPVLALRRLGGA
jgi:MFS family permease